MAVAKPFKLTPDPVREQAILAVALKYLNGPARCVAWRANVIATGSVSATGARRWVRSLPVGHPDIAGILPGGRALFVEIKRPGAQLSPAQVGMLKVLSTMGALALTVHSLDELRTQLRASGLEAP